MRILLVAVGAGLATATLVAAATTVNDVNRYAFGANIGWIDVRADGANGAVFGASHCTGFLWSATCGWIGLGNTPTNGWRYTNTSAADWGVNHDGQGNLTGHAYGANIGWITFEQEHGKPRIDLVTGRLSGYAWGANVGWIGFSNLHAFVRTSLAAGPDTDDDRIPDAWEMQRAGGLTALGPGDADRDGVPDADEYAADTDPQTGERLSIVGLRRVDGTNVVTWTSRPTRIYAVESTNAMPKPSAGWPDAGGGIIGPPATSPSQAAIPQPSGAAAFIRIRATVPLVE